MSSERFYDYSIYIHIFQTGKFFLLRSRDKRGEEVGLSVLIDELEKLEAGHGILLYSLDSRVPSTNPLIQKLLEVISKYRVETQLVDPHPEVYGYNRSFRPYLNETLEVAEIDVEGLKQSLAEARQSFKKAKRGTMDYHREKKHLQILKERLKTAEDCMHRISSLYLELCSVADER